MSLPTLLSLADVHEVQVMQLAIHETLRDLSMTLLTRVRLCGLTNKQQVPKKTGLVVVFGKDAH